MLADPDFCSLGRREEAGMEEAFMAFGEGGETPVSTV